MPLQLRRGTDAQRQSMTEPLAAGELIYVTDTGTIYVGNGTTLGGVPVINITATDIKPLAAQVFTGGSHTGISFTYDSGSQTIDAVVDPDLSNYDGIIRATAFVGSIFPDDSSLGGAALVDGIDASINLDGTVKGNIIPDQDAVYDIGSPSAKFGDLYLSGSSLYLGDAVITSTGTSVNLPLGSTVGGVIIGSGDGVVAGSNYNINIVGDDSTLLIDTANYIINANTINGDLYGSVYAASSSRMIDATSGFVVGDVQNELVTTNRVVASTTTLSGLDSGGNSPGLIVISEVSEDTGPTIDIRTHLASPDGQSFVVSRSRGSLASPTAVQQEDAIFKFLFFGADADGVNAFAGSMAVVADGTPTSGVVPGRFDIYTSDSSGSIALGLSIDSSQIIRVADNTVAANSGSGTADVTGGVLSYLKINVDGTEYAMPLYGLVP